jgi:hypothetical protein
MFGLIEIRDFVFQDTIFFLSEWNILRGFLTLSFEISKAPNEICSLECYCYWVEWLSHRHASLVGVHCLLWQSRSTLGTTLVVLQRFLVLSLYLSTWNFETFRFLGHMQTPILDCKPTWPFSARKFWYNRPTCQPKAFRHRLCIHLGPWHFNYHKHTKQFQHKLYYSLFCQIFWQFI